jgi:ribosomal protein S14
MTPDNQFENGNTAEQHDKPTAYRVEDDDNLEEKDLRRSYLFGKGDEEKSADEPNMEAEGQGGHKFGEDNNTPSGNDQNNPSQNAGNSNAYLGKTEPSDETSTTNFKDPNQLGQPNYSEANGAASTGQSDEENTAPVKEGSGDSGSNPQQPSETEPRRMIIALPVTANCPSSKKLVAKAATPANPVLQTISRNMTKVRLITVVTALRTSRKRVIIYKFQSCRIIFRHLSCLS